MKKSGLTQRVLLGLLLVLLSVFFYTLHYALFRDAHHIFLYLVGDIAFVFVEVLLVTLIIQHLLSEREKRSMLRKLNMVIGAFFSEVGTPLLEYFRAFDANAGELSSLMIVDDSWSPEHFDQMKKSLKNHNFKIDARAGDLEGLAKFIVGKRVFLLGLLENPNLLEHESLERVSIPVFPCRANEPLRSERLCRGAVVVSDNRRRDRAGSPHGATRGPGQGPQRSRRRQGR